MTELILERSERLALRSEAHHLTFAVLLGAAGLTDAVVKEVDRALASHGLIKVKVPTDDKEELQTIYEELADKCNAAKIQHIGKTLVLYRPPEEKEEKVVVPTPAKKKTAKRKPGDKKDRKTKKIIRARPKHKRVTKKAALS